MPSRASSPGAKKVPDAPNQEQASSASAEAAAAVSKFEPPARPAGLSKNVLMLYAMLAGSILFFVLVGESMRHSIAEGKYEKRDGSLIALGDFDPVELGPFPKCHPHFGEHEVVASDGTRSWVKNTAAPSGGPYPPGHPENAEWQKKSNDIVQTLLKETRFKWEGLQPNLHLVVIATLVVLIASKHGVLIFTEPKETRKASEVLQAAEAKWFPVLGSAMLFSLFVIIKYLGTDWVKMAITVAITMACTTGIGINADAILAIIRDKASPTFFRIPFFDEKVTLVQLIGFLGGLGMAAGYILTKNWIVNNLFGISFCLVGIRSIGLSDFKTGAIVLVGLFFYDIFWVFGSKSVFGSNVMVSVATGIDAPIKLMFPRHFGGCGLHQHGMLGLGDIAVPGLFIAFMAKWDAVKIGEKASGSFVYLNSIMVAYVLSLATTVAVMLIFNAAQPALLYIVPYILVTAVVVALVRGEFKDLWSYSIPDETEEQQKREKADETKKGN